MEGDGDIIVDAYNHLHEVCTAAADVSYPNTKAVTIQLANSDVESARLFENTKAYARPALQHFRRKLDLIRISSAFKAQRVFCPKRARQLRPSAASLEGLCCIHALDGDAIIGGLQEELPGTWLQLRMSTTAQTGGGKIMASYQSGRQLLVLFS